MLAVIFEFEPAGEKRDDYLELAARLRDELDGIDGFISIETLDFDNFHYH